LIAGAGVIGIAIGFGAQTLVRDVVSGFFYLVDDAFRIGEYVVIDQIRGTVEQISIRSFQLRHHNGPVHTIPYGEIRTLTNWSRDWAIMKFELRIAFETDIDMVRKIIKQIGTELMEDPVFGANMLQPLKSQGVNRMDDSALIIRCKFTAVPGQQFLIRREAFTRIQRVFEQKGIQFAPRRVLVETSGPPEVAAKAAAAAMDQEIKKGPAPDEP
jgi:small-conductance mechanosensitive channel